MQMFKHLEAARALIDHVIIHPSGDGGPPGIELVGSLAAMLRTAGVVPAGDSSNQTAAVLSSFVSSVKAGPGGKAPWPSKTTPNHPGG
jgi:hypothetical protein